MSVQDVQRKLCANVGGTFSGGACRCSDGSLKNIHTGECVSESSAPLRPMNQPAISPTRTVEEAERADPNGSPRMLSRREAVRLTARDVTGAEVRASGRGYYATSHVVTDQGADIERPNLLNDREAERTISDTMKNILDNAWISVARRPLDATGKAVGSATGATRSGSSDGKPAATVAGFDLPAGLGLAALSFLIFRG